MSVPRNKLRRPALRFRTLWIWLKSVALLLLSLSIIAPAQQAKVSIAPIQSLIRSHEYDQALEATKSALSDSPNDFRLWTLDGIVLSLKGNKDEAIQAFDKAQTLSPNYTAALKGEVQLYYQDRDKRAIPLLEKIVQADPKDETAHEMLAVLEERQGNCESANAHFALSAGPIAKHPDSLEAYGNCLVQTGQLPTAISVFEQLVALLPQRTYPKYDLAVLLVENKQPESAVKILDPLLAADASDPDLLSLASDAYEALGDTPKAVSLLRQAIVLSPATASYYTSFSALCLNHESFQAGIAMIDAGLQRIANDPSLYISRGLLYAQLAEYDKAEADFKTAEKLDAGQSVSAFAIDLAELQKNNSVSDLSQIRAQLQVHPDSALLHFLLAKLLSSQESESDGNVSDEASQSALLAVKLDPNMIEARDLLASIYTHSGQYSLAIDQCRLALKSNPADQAAIYHLIIALRHAGQGEQRDEIPSLVKTLADLQKGSRQLETDRKRFKLVEQVAAPQP